VFSGGQLDFFVGGGEKGAAGESIGPSGKSSGTLMDGQDGLVGEEAFGEAGDFQMLVEIAGHVLELEALQMSPADDPGGQRF